MARRNAKNIKPSTMKRPEGIYRHGQRKLPHSKAAEADALIRMELMRRQIVERNAIKARAEKVPDELLEPIDSGCGCTWPACNHKRNCRNK